MSCWLDIIALIPSLSGWSEEVYDMIHKQNKTEIHLTATKGLYEGDMKKQAVVVRMFTFKSSFNL